MAITPAGTRAEMTDVDATRQIRRHARACRRDGDPAIGNSSYRAPPDLGLDAIDPASFGSVFTTSSDILKAAT